MSAGDVSVRNGVAAPAKIALVAVLATAEMLLTSYLFVFDFPIPRSLNPQYYLRQFVLGGAAATLAFAIICWPARFALTRAWLDGRTAADLRLALTANLALFAVLIAATVGFSRYAAMLDQPPWTVYGLYLVPLALTGLSLFWVAAPLGFWRTLIVGHWAELAMALTVGVAAVVAGMLTQASWAGLAAATLVVSFSILSLYEPDARADYDNRLLGAGDFDVHIDGSCSGYEGIGLIATFLCLYWWIFRRSLAFPNAFLLLPIGIAAIWVLNAVRIAVLVSIGAHVSPQVAVGGFHSQAGWFAFLLVATGIMVAAPRLGFFIADLREGNGASDGANRAMLAFLAPLMALMAASLVASASAPYDHWLYVLKVAAVAICLYVFRGSYARLVEQASPVSLVIGVVVGVLWVVTAPAGNGTGGVAAWITAQPFWLAALWLIIRGLGTVATVPIAEELAFRGLLYRWLISRRFETVNFAQFSWVAFVASSVLFGLTHQRWLGATLAGAAFALVMYRTGRLSDPIAAHMTANALIFLWVLVNQDWSLL